MRSIIFLVILGMLAGGCSHPGIAPVTEALLVNADERMLWRQAEEAQRSLQDSGLIYSDPELETYLNEIARKLQPADFSNELSFQILVIQDPHLNAFAFPNAVIYIHSGILARMDNEAQLAALLAHEMAHCTHRHALRAMRGLKNPPAIVAAVNETLSRVRGLENLARRLGVAGSMAAVSGYCREFEREADNVGLELLLKAGYDASEARKLFEHLKEEIALQDTKEPFFLGTHPKVQQRINNIEDYLHTHQFQEKPSGFRGSEIFLKKVHKVILDNARLDLRLGRFYSARQGAEKYLRIIPEDARAYYLLGEIYRQRGLAPDTQKALRYYQSAIDIDPSYAEPHKAIGFIHFKEGHKILAKKFFESCLSIAPDTPDKAYIQGYLKQCTQNGEG